MNNQSLQKQKGVIELIIVIIIALLIMKYSGITLTEAYNWFRNYFGSVLK